MNCWKRILFIAVLLSGLIHADNVQAQLRADFTTTTPTTGCDFVPVQFINQSQGNPTSFYWIFGNGNVSVLEDPSNAYTVPGTYDVTLIVSDGVNYDTITKPDYITVFESPTPDFSANVLAGCAPLTVQFTDLSATGSSAINGWIWDFGDGNTSTQQNPVHTYYTPGVYTVTLHVQDLNGCADNIVKMDYITVVAPPEAIFTGSPTGACSPPLTVNFTNNSTGTGLSYRWDFGNNTSSVMQNPYTTYTQFGNYDVTLIVQDQYGCRDTAVYDDYITITNLVADFEADNPVGCVPATIQFTDLSTSGPNTWFWDFGDGDTSTQQNPVHTYTSAGTYTVTMFALNSSSCNDTVTKVGYIQIFDPPIAHFGYSYNYSCAPPLTVSFYDSSQGAVSWFWDFGDGNTSTQQNPVHTFTQTGEFTVSLTVMNADSCFDTKTINSAVRIVPPQADFTGQPNQGCVPMTVQFSDSSTAEDSIVSWFWDFGDGATSTQQNPVHIYTVQGVYTVTLIVENAGGCRDTLVLNDFIQCGNKPTANFTASDTIACLDYEIEFTDLSINANEWLWDFGDGGTSMQQNPIYEYTDTGYQDVTLYAEFNGCRDTIVFEDYIYISPPKADFTFTQTCKEPTKIVLSDASLGAHTWLWDFGDGDTSHAQNPVHVYDSSGTYTISLTVKYLPTGCTDSRSIPVTVSDPQANFTVSDSFGCRPLPVDFTNLSKDAVSWQWQSAGLTTQVKNPSFTYRDPGVYDVQLIVTDVNGCKDTLKVDDLITVIGPDAEFGVSTTTGCAPLAVSFQDSSTAFMGNIVSWKWYFGDGDSSSLQNPSHFYDQPGSYDVTLTVTDDNGCSHTLTKNNFVQPTYPAPDFTANQESCSGAPVTFTNLTTGVGLSFLWDFGDGNTSTDPNPVHQYAQPGVYTVTLTATDINGCDSTIVKPDYITISDPVANFTATPTFSPCPPLLAQFHDSSSSDVVSWLWDFGDGFTSTDSMPSHLYVEPGTFTVTLIVTSRWGCKDTIVAPDLAVILGPNGTFTFTPNKGCIDHEVTFTAVTTNTALRTWYFGDGYSQIGGDTITHTYTTTGIFHPVLVMDDGMGCQFARAANDSVIVGKLNIDFNASNTYSCTPGTVDFTGIIQSTPNAVGNLWDFGDGTTSSAANPSHFYTTPGVYDVTLYVNNGVCVDSLTKPGYIAVDPWPIAGITVSDTMGCVPLTVQFTDNTISDSTLVAWKWDFGNGDTSNLQNPVYTYNTPGTYTARLIVFTNTGCPDTAYQTITVNPLPAADAGQDITICAGESKQLQGAGGVTYNWFPATGLSDPAIANPFASPSTTTTYILTVTDANGCTDTDTMTVNVNPLPVIDAGGDLEICIGQTIPLHTTGGITYSWSPVTSLNDPTISNPVASPTVTTTYTVTGVDSNGCQNTDDITVTVHPLPVADAGTDVDICYGESTTLTATGGVDYHWSPSTGLDNINTPQPVASPLTTITYQVLVTDSNGCQNTDDVTVTVHALPLADAGQDTTICFNDVIQLNASGGVQYEWLPASGLSNPQIANPLASPSVTTTYTVKVTDNFGCENTDDLTITVNPLPVVTTSGDVAICFGQETQLHVSGGIQYQWAPAASLNCANCTDPIASPTTTTQYTVEVADANGCVNRDTLTVTVNPNPIGILTPDSTICEGETVQIDAPGGVSYVWLPSAGLSCTNCPDPVAQPQVTTTYTAQVTNVYNCVTTDSITITVNPVPDITISPDITICAGESTELSVTGGDFYEWTPSAGLSAANISNPMAIPTVTTTYQVKVSNTYNCSVTDSVTVTVNPVTDVYAGEDVTICKGDNVGLTAVSSDAVSYSWTPVTGLINLNSQYPYASPQQTTTYILTANNPYNCPNTDTVVVNVITHVNTSLTGDTSICQGESIQLQAEILQSGHLGTEFIWYPARDINATTVPNPIVKPQETTTYHLIAFSGSCIPDTQKVTVTVNPLPVVDAGEDKLVVRGTGITLSPEPANDDYQYSWSPAEGLSCNDCAKPSLTATYSGVYTVTATDKNGCTATDSVQVKVIPKCGDDVFVANTITPNHDDINDKAYIRHRGAIIKLNYFKVFNRWGELVWQTDDINEGWDGTQKGEPLNPGVFVYHIEAVCSNGQTIRLKGNITLLK